MPHREQKLTESENSFPHLGQNMMETSLFFLVRPSLLYTKKVRAKFLLDRRTVYREMMSQGLLRSGTSFTRVISGKMPFITSKATTSWQKGRHRRKIAMIVS